MPNNELQGRTAIVTGAAGGIGRAIAELFLREGANVVITGRRVDVTNTAAQELDAVGEATCLAIPGDQSDETAVDALVAQTVDRFGQLDILVNNAAVAGAIGKIWELDLAGWQQTLDINLTGPWLCTRAAARVMVPREEGKIIFISSVTGKRPLATRTPYASTKMGIVGLARTAALELGEHNINVNVVSPGAVDGERLVLIAKTWGVPLEEVKRSFSDLSDLKRLPVASDIADMALFFASERSRNITGFDVNVDGGIWPV